LVAQQLIAWYPKLSKKKKLKKQLGSLRGQRQPARSANGPGFKPSRKHMVCYGIKITFEATKLKFKIS